MVFGGEVLEGFLRLSAPCLMEVYVFPTLRALIELNQFKNWVLSMKALGSKALEKHVQTLTRLQEQSTTFRQHFAKHSFWGCGGVSPPVI